MTYEASLRDRLADPIDFTVADGYGIEKGAWVKMSGARTAVAASKDAMAAGIAAREKIASDGRTNLPVFTRGIFDCYVSGTALVGEPMALSADNYIYRAVLGMSGAQIVGYMIEPATATAGVYQVFVNIGGGAP